MFTQWISQNADYLVFASAGLGLFGLLSGWLRWSGREVNFHATIWVMLVGILAAGWFLVDRAGALERRSIRQMVEGFAPTYALEMQGFGHAKVTPETAADDPLYLELIALEMNWLRVNPVVSDIYTMRKLADGRMVLLVDSETDYDRDGKFAGEREARTKIGEVYEKTDPALERAFAGESGFTAEPMSDRWGTWVSAFVPIYDGAGKVEGILGVDYDATTWIEQVAAARLSAIGFLCVLLATLAASGTVVALLASSLAVRGRIETQLLRAKADADAANRAKSDFLATMSHEIRTPMNGVLGFTSLLLETPLSAEQMEFTRIIKSSGDALLTLINDILDFSKIEAGKMELEKAGLDLEEIAGQVVSLLSPQAAAKGLELSLDYAAEAPRQMMGDASRVRQILLNLTGNAVKFTRSGSVRLGGALGAEGYVKITVTDTGIGINEAQQKLLFQKFTQVDSSAKRKFSGSGLGLAICKRLVELMGGEIGVQSQEGRGSVFWPTLPLSEVCLLQRTEEDAEAGADAGEPGFSGRLLFVEDNSVHQRLAVEMLEKWDCQVDVAADGLAALKAVGAAQYDLILMDCQLPEMDGYAVTRAIREAEAGGARVPIIALTASVMPADRAKCVQAGMDGFLAKPLQQRELELALRRWLRKVNVTAGIGAKG